MISISGSFQVPPAELEVLLISHPAIEDAAVIGVPDAEEGELPMAFVVRKADVTLTEKDVHVYVDENVAAYKKLRGGVEFIDEIPKSLSGKILRRELKDRLKKLSKVESPSGARKRSFKRSVRQNADKKVTNGNSEGVAKTAVGVAPKSSCCLII